MVFQNARYCNGFPTIRRNSDTLEATISSTVSDGSLFVPEYSGHKMGTVMEGAGG